MLIHNRLTRALQAKIEMTDFATGLTGQSAEVTITLAASPYLIAAQSQAKTCRERVRTNDPWHVQ